MDEPVLQLYSYIFRPDLLRGKVALITGGGSGICFTIAEVLMRHKCSVAIASRNSEKLKAAAKKLRDATGGECLPLQVDVRKPSQVVEGVRECLRHLGKLHFLINGAAGNFLCAAASLSMNALKAVMEIDALGTFNMSKAVYENYFRSNGGVIVNISATLHLNGVPLQTHAGAAKAAVDAMTRHLAVEWGQDGVRVVGVAPGAIRNTVGFDKLGGNELTDQFAKSVPLGRCGERVEIANTVLFLISDAASLITGETVIADGGSWLTMHPGMSTMMEAREDREKSKL